jgi:SWI/SNF related-matrix-associated actin-dependent regulator of chromatin subfamily C
MSNGAIPNVAYACDTCGTDCTPVRYHSLKVKGFELCPPCYLDGRFPSTMFSGDFVKLTSGVNGVGHGNDDDWADQEVLLLLEGIEMYDDDWSAIEEHVGTRSAQQCIQKFLALPIEDPYLATEGAMGPLRYGRIPFEQADNPVMSVVAFLAGVVSPGVAAEAAKTALHALTDGDKKEADAEAEGEKIAEGDGERKEEKDEKMEEDNEEAAHEDAERLSSKVGTPAPYPDGMSVNSPPKKKSTVTIPHSKVARAADLALRSSAKAAKALADAEDTHIRSTLASLIKLTLTKLELKMSQFEELEEILEEERKGIESARMALVSERVSLKRILDNIKDEMATSGQTVLPPVVAQANLGTTGQGTVVNEVQSQTDMEGDSGPVSNGNVAHLT